MTELYSEIEKIDTENRCITIKSVPPTYAQSFYAEEKYMKGINFEQLSVGDKVKFTPFKNIAQNIKLVGSSNDEKIISEIIKKTNDIIIIQRISPDQPKDFFAKKEFIKNIDFDHLKEGQKVRFKPFQSKDSYIAQDIEILSSTPQTQKTDQLSEISKDFILSIQNKVKNTKDGHLFEDDTFLILKLLGVLNLYPIPKDRQEGKCDGIFKIDNLEVIYDCTLRESIDWKERKKTQISNYINQIKQTQTTERYILDGKSINKTISFNPNADKHIWIITKDKTNIYEDIDGVVVVKEICIYDLIKLVEERMLDMHFYQEKDIARKLKDLGI